MRPLIQLELRLRPRVRVRVSPGSFQNFLPVRNMYSTAPRTQTIVLYQQINQLGLSGIRTAFELTAVNAARSKDAGVSNHWHEKLQNKHQYA